MTTQSDTPEAGTGTRLITDWVFEWARTTPDASAMTYEQTEYTWAEWADRIRRVAGGLAAAGIGHGDRVAFLDKNHLACLEVTQGASHIGAATAVVNWRLAGDELRYVLGDCTPRILFVGEELLTAYESIKDDLTGIERVIVVGEGGDYEAWQDSAPAGGSESVATPDDVALLLYTSGTTGFPKGAMLTHQNLVAHTLHVAPSFPMEPGDRNLIAMPLFHVGGSAYALVGLAAGVPSTLLREVTGPGLVGAVAGGCTHAFLVPAVLAGLVQAGPAAMTPMARLKICCYGSSPCPLPVLRTCMEAWPDTGFLHVFGMTELSGVATTLPPEAHRDTTHPERLASAGTPILGVEMRIVDPATFEDVRPGEAGEMWFRTDQVMAGYLGRPEATAEAITEDGWLRSGDVGRLDDGGFLFIEDRIKDMILTGAENVYSPEVERVIQEHPAVAEVAVIGVPDETWGESVLAVVAPQPDATIDPDELRAFCREHLAGYKCPKQVEIREALPRSATGKILKAPLRAPYWEGHDRKI